MKDFNVERSTDGIRFTPVAKISPNDKTGSTSYKITDDISNTEAYTIYYRLRTTDINGTAQVSKIVSVTLKAITQLKASIVPNPVKDILRVNIYSPADRIVQLAIYDNAGRLLQTINQHVVKGNSVISLSGFKNWERGVYLVKITSGNESLVERLVLVK